MTEPADEPTGSEALAEPAPIGRRASWLRRHSAVAAAIVVGVASVLAAVVPQWFPAEGGTTPPGSGSGGAGSGGAGSGGAGSGGAGSGRISSPPDRSDIPRCLTIDGVVSSGPPAASYWLVIRITSGGLVLSEPVSPLSDGTWRLVTVVGGDGQPPNPIYELMLVRTAGALSDEFRRHAWPRDQRLPPDLGGATVLHRITVRRTTHQPC